jgi:hypothetical protein
MNERYSTKPITIKEHWYIDRIKHGDIEATVLLLQSRCLDPSLDFWAMTLSELDQHIQACTEALKMAFTVENTK